MERTKGNFSMGEAAVGTSLVRTKASKKHNNLWRNKLTDAQAQVVRLIETNAFGYHSFHKKWLTQQPLHIILAYTHPTARETFVTDLRLLGVNY